VRNCVTVAPSIKAIGVRRDLGFDEGAEARLLVLLLLR